MLASNKADGAAIVKLLLACPGIEVNLQNKVNPCFFSSSILSTILI